MDLAVEVRYSDGTVTHFHQTDAEHIRKALRSLASPRLLMQPLLAVAAENSATAIPTRTIAMILARTSGEVPLIFPLTFPAGLLDIVEVDEDSADGFCGVNEGENDAPVSPLVWQVAIHTLGGWAVNLKILAPAGKLVHDQRHWFAHLLNLPVIAFRLRGGGIGLIHPASITSVSAHPKPDGVPEAVLPMDLPRRSPSRSVHPAGFAEAMNTLTKTSGAEASTLKGGLN